MDRSPNGRIGRDKSGKGLPFHVWQQSIEYKRELNKAQQNNNEKEETRTSKEPDWRENPFSQNSSDEPSLAHKKKSL